MKGISKPVLYYDFDCTMKVDDVDGIFKIDLGYVSNKISDATINVIVKNEGTHKLYSMVVKSVLGDIVSVNAINELEPNNKGILRIIVNKGTLFPASKNVMVVLEYDNI